MSNKLVRKKKNKPKYDWMQSEIDAVVRRYAYDKHVAGYAVIMMQHVLEIGLWTLHDKFGFGRKRLERVQGIFNEYLKEHYEKKLNVREFPILVQAKAGADVEAEAKKFSQKCRMNLAKMEYPKNPRDLKVKLITITDALSTTYAMICTELITREKMSGTKVRKFLEECAALINEYLDDGWICQEDIRQILAEETGIRIALD